MVPAKKITLRLENNSREYERSLRGLESTCADLSTRKLELLNRLNSLFMSWSELNLESKGPIGEQAQLALVKRSEYEQVLRDQLSSLELTIGQLNQTLDVKIVAADNARREVEEYISADLTFANLKAEHETKLMENKLALTQESALQMECNVKKKSFDSNPLYLYLKEKHYGEVPAPRNPIIRFMDRKIAAFCNFTLNNDNEQILKLMEAEIDQRAHNRLHELESLTIRVDDYSQRAQVKFQLPQAIEAVETIKKEILGLKKKANVLHESLSQFANKRDAYYADVKRYVSEFLSEKKMEDLIQLAESSSHKLDNQLYEKILSLKNELEVVDSQYAQTFEKKGAAQLNYARAKSIERDIKKTSFLDSDCRYPNNFDFNAILLGFMDGALDASQVSRALKQEHEIESPYVSHYSQSSLNTSSYNGNSFSSGSSSNARSSSSDDSWSFTSSSSSSSGDSSSSDSYSTSDEF